MTSFPSPIGYRFPQKKCQLFASCSFFPSNFSFFSFRLFSSFLPFFFRSPYKIFVNKKSGGLLIAQVAGREFRFQSEILELI